MRRRRLQSKKLHPILPLVFYTGRRQWKKPISLATMMDIPTLMEAFIPKWDTLFLNLRETPQNLLVEDGSPVAQAFRVLQAMKLPLEDLAGTLKDVTSTLDTLPASEQLSWTRVMLYMYLLVKHARPAGEHEALFDEMDRAILQHRSEWEETEMTGAQVLINQGRRAGREEGRAEGREEGREEVLLELIRSKFGAVPKTSEDKVRSLSARQVSDTVRLVLKANKLEDLGL